MDDVILCSAIEDFKDFVSTDSDEVQNVPETPHRCTNCGKLFFKGKLGEDGRITVKCSRCSTINVFTVHTPPKNFQDRILQNSRRKFR